MTKLRLKITGIAVLILGVIIVVNAFWPAETAPVDESRNVERMQKVDKADLEPQAGEQYSEPERLYQKVLAHKERDDSRDVAGYKMAVDCCKRILQEFPDSPQAQKAGELLQELHNEHQTQYAGKMSLRYSTPAVRKSRSLRRRR